ncbi:MAG TPA: hypothetical protein VFV34_23475 [Blastocatellia bacterium]|nr:hypothetical protein [Blastocatellia bacterium]
MYNSRESEKTDRAWGRLALGFIQMSLAAMAAGVLLTLGLHPLTYALTAAATVATILGRLIYRRKPRRFVQE